MSSSGPAVACIITTFGRPQRVREALLSVVAQDYEPLEIVVIDDNPPDSSDTLNTERLLSPILKRCGGRLLRTGGEKGAPAARNLGIQSTGAPLIAFLDDDDIWLQGKTRAQVDALSVSPPDVRYSYCGLEYRNDENRPVGVRNISPGKNPFRTHILSQLAPTSCLMVKRSAFDEVGLFANLKAGQDYELQLRLLNDGNVVHLRDKLVHLRVHGGERISSGTTKLVAAKQLLEVKRHYFERLGRRDRRYIEAHYYSQIGRYMILEGAMGDGLRSLLMSLLKRPLRMRVWAWVAYGLFRKVFHVT